MLRVCLTIFLTLLLSADTQNLSDVIYSFEKDFYRKFDSKRCDGRSEWHLVRYDALNIKSLYVDSDKGIQASRKSCTSSFSMIFNSGTLEIDAYVRGTSQKLGISIEVFDEDETSLSRFVYGTSSKGFEQGWSTISFQFYKKAKGYIQLQGTSLNSEILVIDSFRYKPNNTYTRNFENRYKRGVNNEDGNKTENVYDKEEMEVGEENIKFESTTENNEGSTEEETFQNIGVSGSEGISDRRTETATETNQEPQQNEYSFWNLFSIFFVTFALVLFALLIGVSAYHCGKIRAIESSVPPIFIDDLEPARTITIPRVTGTCEIESRFTIFA